MGNDMNYNKLINFKNIKKAAKNFKSGKPFNYCVIDNFFKNDFAKKLEKEIPKYDDKIWLEYNNPIEIKKF